MDGGGARAARPPRSPRRWLYRFRVELWEREYRKVSRDPDHAIEDIERSLATVSVTRPIA